MTNDFRELIDSFAGEPPEGVVTLADIRAGIALLNTKATTSCFECGLADERPVWFVVAEGYSFPIHEDCLERIEQE